jgi:hypothetical protein
MPYIPYRDKTGKLRFKTTSARLGALGLIAQLGIDVSAKKELSHYTKQGRNLSDAMDMGGGGKAAGAMNKSATELNRLERMQKSSHPALSPNATPKTISESANAVREAMNQTARGHEPGGGDVGDRRSPARIAEDRAILERERELQSSGSGSAKGKGRGNWGHKGRKGMRGGSA